MTLLVPGRDPRLLRIAGGAGPLPGASASFIPDFRGAASGAIVIGQPTDAGTRGRVHVFFLDGGLDSIPNLTLEGDSHGDLFGSSVAGAGDLDGDGFGDLAVGAPGGGAGMGRVYLFRGALAPGASPAGFLDGSAAHGRLCGAALAGGRDLNGDARDDCAVGAPGGPSGGYVAILRGGLSLPEAFAELLTPAPMNSYASRRRFGSSLAIGDLTGDGEADLAVGAPGDGNERGRVWVYAGGQSTLQPGIEIAGLEPSDQMGHALAISDFSADPAPDLAVSSPGAAVGRGRVSVLYGGTGFNASPDFTDSGEHEDDAFGFALAAGSLFPRTEVPQVLVGAPLSDHDGINTGLAFVMAVPPAVAVEAGAVVLEVEGELVSSGSFVDPAAPMTARRADGGAIDVSGSVAELDGVPCAIRSSSDPLVIGIVLPATAPDGRHHLRVGLASAGVMISVEREIVTARSFQLMEARVWPSPARGRAELGFAMTRAGSYRLLVFDAAGRRVLETIPATGIAGGNRADLAGLESLRNGIYFVHIEAEFRTQRRSASCRFAIVR